MTDVTSDSVDETIDQLREENQRLRQQVDNWERKEITEASCCMENEERAERFGEALLKIQSIVSFQLAPRDREKWLPRFTLEQIERALLAGKKEWDAWATWTDIERNFRRALTQMEGG